MYSLRSPSLIRVSETVESRKTCAVFTGQSSEYPGMYKHLLQDPTFFRVVEKADEVYAALGQQPISKYLKGEDIRTLSTPALFTVQVALFEMLRETGFEPDYLTGFSFGEYAALSCAGVISFKDALALIHYRELHSPPAGELGKLLAVTASPEKIATILRETAFSIAGKNSPRQTLIATAHPDQVQKMLQGVRTLVVDVDQP
ncbi:MAG: acyltransferase domain-containing protein, partial [Candidatus Woesearchaeota archaeon]|nr:acyltransferase domain-containing protein [Candidatus Woesearchaeota archaeon]